jgi:hypothetical protein
MLPSSRDGLKMASPQNQDLKNTPQAVLVCIPSISSFRASLPDRAKKTLV